MLLTFPFLFAFYAMLSQAIEIRGANFVGWMTNLSAPDPYFVLPILMGATQFWQTKMTPTTADPAQQKIMMFMPLMFTAMSFSFPSGLVLYWLVSTLFTIGQQYFTNYLVGAPTEACVTISPLGTAGTSGTVGTLSMATADITAFVQKVVEAMDLDLEASAEEMPDGVRINLTGEDGNVLIRRQGEALAALQHIVAAIYRHEASEGRRLVVDCMGYRKGKDDELKQMALFLGGKAKDTGLAQEIGPLNPYERRIVHLAVAELESVTSESIGDAFEKTVIISVK